MPTDHEPREQAAPQQATPGRAEAPPERGGAPGRGGPGAPGRATGTGPDQIASGALSAPAQKLPFADQIQRAFGRHSLATVRARIGPAATQAAKELGTTGFAYGEDIILGDNPTLHVVAHEAAHVIQQRGHGTAAGVDGGGGGGDHEQHAEQVAHMVERGESAEALLDQYSPGGAVTSARAIQRFGGERPFTDYGAITKDPAWLPAADAYEKRLGAFAYNHARSKGVLDAALDKMTEVLMEHFKDELKNKQDKNNLLREAYTKDDATSAGQIGTTNIKDIRSMLASGNLRERMTAFYNAAYFNGSGKPPSDQPRGFKQIAKGILYEGDTTSATKLDMDDTGMAELAQFNQGWWRYGAQMATAGFDNLNWLGNKVGLLDKKNPTAYNFADDPFALGNLSLAKELSGTGEIGSSQNGRNARDTPGRTARAKSPADYAAMNMPLSARELKYAKRKTPGVNADPANGKLDWLPGDSYWKMPDQSGWISKIQGQLHMPVIAGVSGTTTRMMSAFQWLKTGASALDFRLALIGWMLSMGDHSLYEILRGGQLAGVFGGDEGNLDDVVRIYMNVAPLPTTELRAGAGWDGGAEKKMFPHEQIYLEKAKRGKDTATGFLGADGTNTHAGVAADDNFSAAHATAIYVYTSGIHPIMNAILEAKKLKLPVVLAHQMVQSKLLGVIDQQARTEYLTGKNAVTALVGAEKAEYDWLVAHPIEDIDVIGSQTATWLAQMGDHTKTPEQVKAYRNGTVAPWIKANLPRMYDELLAHTNMAVEGLKAMPAAPSQTVWRGDWQNNLWQYKVGSEIGVDVLRSFSTDKAVAEGFMSEGKFSSKVLLEVVTKAGGRGRDINALSKYPEAEILMMPGAKLRVTAIRQETLVGSLVPHTVLVCAEI